MGDTKSGFPSPNYRFFFHFFFQRDSHRFRLHTQFQKGSSFLPIFSPFRRKCRPDFCRNDHIHTPAFEKRKT